MKLSIVTINYNNAAGLLRTIESVIDQDWKDFEYIIIDGGSSDESVEIIKRYENHISKWVSEKDSGIYSAMNKGIDRAVGEYCLFLNSGDFLIDPKSLERAFSHRVEADVVSFSIVNTDRVVSYYKRPPKIISLYTFLYGELPHPSSFIKRELFVKIGRYDERYRIISDWCFFVDALIINNASYQEYDDVLSVFDRSGISISTNFPEMTRAEQHDYLAQKFPRIYRDYDIPEYCSNSVFYLLTDAPKLLKIIVLIPFRILNRILKLRNRLGRKVSIEKIRFKIQNGEDPSKHHRSL